MVHKKYMEISELGDAARQTKFSVNSILKHNGYQNKPLSFEQAYLLGAFTLSGYVSELQEEFDTTPEVALRQSLAALCTLHNRALYEQEGSAQQIAGICSAVFDHDIGTASKSFVQPNVEMVMDNCGMGGDLYRTPNLSTIAALIAAADGIPMLKHGSPGNTDSTGSSDFLVHCGVDLYASKETVESGVEKFNFGYTEALDEGYKRIHSQTHQFAKLAHMNDIIGPITNPVVPHLMRRRVIGVNHLIPPERIAEAYAIMNRAGVTAVERGFFVRGFADPARTAGIDEVSLMGGGTLVAELYNDDVESRFIFAQDFGLHEMEPEELDPGKNKAETSRRIVSGEITGGKQDAALANAALLFHLAQGISLKESTEKSRNLIESGKPFEILQNYAEHTQGEKNG
ncbi:hypothetical protein HOC32_05710 [Candidatus Woesearchaeota archaeon]|jgi:anthranilate phosphoribosyltransferase|nr:hypothetical protein [Candidatus Woesearchaeota archaeon]